MLLPQSKTIPFSLVGLIQLKKDEAFHKTSLDAMWVQRRQKQIQEQCQSGSQSRLDPTCPTSGSAILPSTLGLSSGCFRTCPGYCSHITYHVSQTQNKSQTTRGSCHSRSKDTGWPWAVALLIYSSQASEKRHLHILSMPLKPKAPESKHCKGLWVVCRQCRKQALMN